MPSHTMRLPDWIRPHLTGYSTCRSLRASSAHGTRDLLKKYRVTTVCEEARCPNRAYCYEKPTATFMILGDNCTRDCGFCAVRQGDPAEIDLEEPRRVALAARQLGLRYVVITSVTRDDLPDGGASQYVATVAHIRRLLPGAGVEVLIPDFAGNGDSLRSVADAAPDILNHNIETVPRLYATVRPRADYTRSLSLLRALKEYSPAIKTKSGLMLGLGETIEEVITVMTDLRATGCDLLTIGQYLKPAKKSLPVVEYIHPEIFSQLREKARDMGFSFAASGPLVRSSMNAAEMFFRKQEE